MSISVKEAAERLNITVRAVQLRCKKDKIRKKNNTYLITEANIETWRAEPKEKTGNEANERNEAKHYVNDTDTTEAEQVTETVSVQ